MMYTIMLLGVPAMYAWASGVWPGAVYYWAAIFMLHIGTEVYIEKFGGDDGLW